MDNPCLLCPPAKPRRTNKLKLIFQISDGEMETPVVVYIKDTSNGRYPPTVVTVIYINFLDKKAN